MINLRILDAEIVLDYPVGPMTYPMTCVFIRDTEERRGGGNMTMEAGAEWCGHTSRNAYLL